MYGFRCSIDGISSSYSVLMNPNICLEQEFIWLCSNACRLLIQAPMADSERFKRLSIAERNSQVLIEKHGILLKKGLNLDEVPTLQQILNDDLSFSTKESPGKIFVVYIIVK